MKQASPSFATAQFIAKILASSQVPVSAVGETIRGIDAVLRGLAASEAPAVATYSEPASGTPVKTPKRTARPPVAEAPRARIAAAVPEAPAAPRKRGRRPRVERPMVVEPDEVEDVALVAAARLVRRTTLVNENDVPAFLQSGTARSEATRLRGVVKWFDVRNNKGALRLAGISADVLIEPAVLSQSTVKRLYKDQEIEAEISHASGKPVLTGLYLPGWAAPTATFGGGNASTGTRTVTRQARPVVVEIKRDAGKQRRERARAEQILAGDGDATPETV